MVGSFYDVTTEGVGRGVDCCKPEFTSSDPRVVSRTAHHRECKEKTTYLPIDYFNIGYCSELQILEMIL